MSAIDEVPQTTTVNEMAIGNKAVMTDLHHHHEPRTLINTLDLLRRYLASQSCTRMGMLKCVSFQQEQTLHDHNDVASITMIPSPRTARNFLIKGTAQ
mmetsp:Transcript_23673/g.58035  ORF Transcript_23673/g.58035 Transcript_23673/m.58035 type:complete len:98 (-) Transcript_23673:18-311(-)